MAKPSSTIDVGTLRRGDQALGMLGARPFFMPTLQKIDLDPEPLLQTLEVYRQAVATVRSVQGAIQTPVGGDGCWEGDGRDQADEYRKCVAAWWQQILDFLLGIVDWLVQLIDWILDALRWACQGLVWLAAWVAAAVTAIALILIATGVGAAALPILSTVFVWAGGIGVLAFILGIILKLLDYLIEWFQGLIRSGRDALCGGGVIPRTDNWDWDPAPLPLPTWPF